MVLLLSYATTFNVPGLYCTNHPARERESKKEKQRGEEKREENKRGRGEREKLGWDIDVGRHGLHAQTLIIQKELPVWRVRVAEHLNNS